MLCCQQNVKSAVLITGLIRVISLYSSLFTSLYNYTLGSVHGSAAYSAALGHGVESQGCTYIQCTLYIIHCTLDTAHCVQCTLYRYIQWAPGIRRLTRQPICLHYTTTSLTQGYCVRHTMYSVLCTVFSVQFIVYSVQRTASTAHCICVQCLLYRVHLSQFICTVCCSECQAGCCIVY